MQLFYSPNIKKNDEEIHFSKEESRHIFKVLRKNNGDQLKVTNGKGFLFTAEIYLSGNSCRAKINKVEEQDPPSYSLHLAVAPTKMNDRYEWFLEKATEIGIQQITPIICEHSERKVVKLARYERVLQSALKQSLQYHFPVLNEATPFSKFIQQDRTGQTFIAHCESENEKKALKNEVQSGQNVTILIGPEGDFSLEEISMAKEKNYVPVTLGNSRLRTETAAIVACHTIALLNE